MGERFLRLWSELAQGVFPFIMEEVGELDYDHRLFVSVCEAVIDPKEFEYAKWCGNGRPKADRVSIFKAYILKMTLNLKGDKELVELLRQQPLSRRMCGWGSAGLVPSRPSFCRAFAEFAERGFTEKWFADFIRKYHGDIPEETVSFDSVPIHVRAKVANAKRRLAKLDPDQPEPPPRLSCLGGQSAAESIADLPVECEWGCKRDSQGKTKFWKGGKAHVSTTRDGVPVAFVYTSANLHDSQAAIPLMKQASERLEYHFDLMDAAYDADPIRDESSELGHVPIIDFNARRSPAAGDVTYRAAPEGVPGAVLVTADADGAPRFECVGEAAPGRRMEPDTVFWMASNTKGVLGALVLNLATEGKLSLDDPVEKYFPSWKNLAATNRPTLRMLLCHTSGLARFPKADLPRPGMEALAERAAEQPLAYEPGTKYVYSNWDIDVAAAITEKVTGRPFDVEMRERILKPLGMTDTTFVPTTEQVARRTTVYKLSADKPPRPEEPVRKLVNPYLHIGEHPEAGGGLLSTPQDMIKFFQMIARGGRTPDGKILISEPLMRAWATKQTPPAIKTAYSFGMAVNGKGGISHGGACGTWGEANINTHKARLYMVNFQGKSKASKAFHAEWKRRTELTSAR